MRPRLMMATWSHTCSTSESRWELRNTVMPAARSVADDVAHVAPADRDRARRSARPARPAGGSASRAWASPMRWCMPLENVARRSRRRCASPTSSSISGIVRLDRVCPGQDRRGDRGSRGTRTRASSGESETSRAETQFAAARPGCRRGGRGRSPRPRWLVTKTENDLHHGALARAVWARGIQRPRLEGTSEVDAAHRVRVSEGLAQVRWRGWRFGP